jgi:hypothetical protein
VFANQAGLDFTACDTHAGWTTAVHEDDRVVVVEAWREAFQELVPLLAALRLHGHDGSYLGWTATAGRAAATSA